MSVLTCEVVDLSDLSTPVAGCASTLARSLQDNYNETGTFFVTFANDDPDLVECTTPNRLMNFYLDGVLVFTGVIEAWEATYASQGEEHDNTTTVRGSGHVALFDRHLVYPALALGARPIEEDRGANWEAAIYDWVGHGAVAATAVDSVANAQAGSFGAGNWDADFAAPGADILGPTGGTPTSAPVGDWYVHQTATLASSGNFQLQVLASTFADVSFDGAHVMSPGQDSDTFPWLKMTTANIELTAGLHTIAARVANFGGGTGFAFALVEVNDDGSLGSVAGASGAAFAEVIDYPAEVPGMTPGEAALLFIGEAQSGTALGGGRATGDPLAFINLITLTFDETLDTNGDPWDQLPDYATKVSTSLLQVWRELTTYADFWMTPGTLDFNMAIKGARGTTQPTSFTRPTAGPSTGNILEWTAKAEGPKTNALLIRSEAGWTGFVDASAVSAHGRMEAPIAYGAVTSAKEGYRMADADLEDFARERVQHTIEIAPTGGAFADTYGTDFFVGDTIDLEGDGHVVLGMGLDQTNDTVRFTPILNDGVVLDDMERLAQWLTKQLPMTMRGRSARVQPHVPQFQPRSRPVPLPADYFTESFPGTGDLGTITTDQPWTVGAGDVPEVDSDECTVEGTSSGVARCDTTLSTQDQWMEIDFTALYANDQIYIHLREDTTGGSEPNGDQKLALNIFYSGGGFFTVRIEDWFTAFAAVDVTSPELSGSVTAAPSTFRFEVTGNTASAYYGSTLLGTADVSASAAAGPYIGFSAYMGGFVNRPFWTEIRFGDL